MLRQRSILQGILPFELIQEVVRVVPVAEEQPGPAARSDRAPFLHEGAEGSDARAGADHDDVGRRGRAGGNACWV